MSYKKFFHCQQGAGCWSTHSVPHLCSPAHDNTNAQALCLNRVATGWAREIAASLATQNSPDPKILCGMPELHLSPFACCNAQSVTWAWDLRGGHTGCTRGTSQVSNLLDIPPPLTLNSHGFDVNPIAPGSLTGHLSAVSTYEHLASTSVNLEQELQKPLRGIKPALSCHTQGQLQWFPKIDWTWSSTFRFQMLLNLLLFEAMAMLANSIKRCIFGKQWGFIRMTI